jgi:hypothetical protein
MELHDVAVFGTRHILTESPVFDGQQPAYQEYFRGDLLAWYSTGKLEEALAKGMEVYVVSIRPVFGQQDAWWQALVPADRVFNATGIFAAAVNGDPLEASFAPWRRLYRQLGVPWPEGQFSDFDDPSLWLASNCGVKDGSLFTGHRLLC